MNQIETFELAAQISGEDADAVVFPHFQSIKRGFASLQGRNYSSEVDQFSFVLRVDGAVRSWGFEGTDAIEHNREERYVTVDIGVPKSWWEKLPPNAVAENIRNALTKGLIDMIAFIDDRGVHVDEETILSDFNDALKME